MRLLRPTGPEPPRKTGIKSQHGGRDHAQSWSFVLHFSMTVDATAQIATSDQPLIAVLPAEDQQLDLLVDGTQVNGVQIELRNRE